MAYSALAVANSFITRSKTNQAALPQLTPLKLQKLVYFAHAWHLKLFDSPLIDEFFAKWKYGPVVPSLYYATKPYSKNNIDTLLRIAVNNQSTWQLMVPLVPENDDRVQKLFDKIVEVYGSFSAVQLSELTHRKDTAWYKTADDQVIDNLTIKHSIIS